MICPVTRDERLEEGGGLLGDVNLGDFSVEAIDKVFRNSELTEKEVQKL